MQPKFTNRRSLHKFVIGGIFVWILFVASLPLAYMRVSQTKPFKGSPFKALQEAETQKPIESYSKLRLKAGNLR